MLLIVIAVIVVVALQPPQETPVEETPVTEVEEETVEEESLVEVFDMANRTKLKAIPDDYQLSGYYQPFEYILPEEFLAEGDPYLTSIEGWFDTVNLDGVRLTFSNGLEDLQTEVFGLKEDRRGE